MTLKKTIFLLLSAAFVLFVMVAPGIVDADGGQYGQYGGGSETPSEQPKEEVVHTTVEADLGDNVFALAAVVGGSALALFILSKVTARVYLLD